MTARTYDRLEIIFWACTHYVLAIPAMAVGAWWTVGVWHAHKYWHAAGMTFFLLWLGACCVTVWYVGRREWVSLR